MQLMGQQVQQAFVATSKLETRLVADYTDLYALADRLNLIFFAA